MEPHSEVDSVGTEVGTSGEPASETDNSKVQVPLIGYKCATCNEMFMKDSYTDPEQVLINAHKHRMSAHSEAPSLKPIRRDDIS